MYGGIVECPLKCTNPDESQCFDSQEHLLYCKKVKEKCQPTDLSFQKIIYKDIFSNNVRKLKEIAVLYTRLLEIKQELMEKQEPASLDPCIGALNQCNGDTVCTPVIHCMSTF